MNERVAATAVAALILCLGCSSNEDDSATPSSAATSTSQTMPEVTTSTTGAVQAIGISGVGGCEGSPPFTVTSRPDDIAIAIEEGPPAPVDPNEEILVELYDPSFHSLGAPGRALLYYHGNAWRLTVALIARTTVLGFDGTVGTMNDGSPIVEFPVVSNPAHMCDFWALAGRGFTVEELLAVTSGLAP